MRTKSPQSPGVPDWWNCSSPLLEQPVCMICGLVGKTVFVVFVGRMKRFWILG